MVWKSRGDTVSKTREKYAKLEIYNYEIIFLVFIILHNTVKLPLQNNEMILNQLKYYYFLNSSQIFQCFEYDVRALILALK